MEQDSRLSVEATALSDSARRAVKTARKVAESNYAGWHVRAFFGTSPEDPDGATAIAYSACATTPDIQQSREPTLLGVENAILIELGSRGVLWIRANTRSDLTRKLRLALRGFRWGRAREGRAT